MKTLQWAAAALAVGALALPARAETVTTNDWWDVTFEPNSFKEGFPGLEVGELGTLTNDESKATVIQPYASGVWSMIDGDESYVTNGVATNWVGGAMTEVASATYVKLDTQGNDLTWKPTENPVDDITTLVDADLYLVGSDSPPDAGDFDSAGDVQTAIYLKNEINEESGETTNSVLCVYAYDANGDKTVDGKKGNYWQELEGVELDDNAWAHVQVSVDHSGDVAEIKVFVNGTQMHARGGTALQWTAANGSTSANAHKVSSVAFRGTGAVDNFSGKTLQTSFEEFDFTAEVYMNGSLVETGTGVNQTKVVRAQAGSDKSATFTGFSFHDFVAGSHATTFSLAKIELIDLSSGSTSTYNYIYDNTAHQITPETPSENIVFATAIEYIEDEETGDMTEVEYQTGVFSILAPTAGATANATIAKIYFEDLPEEGTYNAIATTTVGETTTSDAKKVRPSEFAEGATKTITWEFPATKDGGYVLRTVSVQNGATASYADGTATVSVTLSAALSDNTTYANATYVEGDYTGKTPQWIDNGDGSFTLGAFEAKIGTTLYETLADAVDAVPADAAEATTITLVADITMSSGVTIPANKLVALDMAEHAITGPANGYVFGVQGELAVDGEGSITAMVPFYLGGEGALVVKSGSFTGTYSAVLFADGADGASVTVNGGTLTAPDAIGSSGKNVTIAVHGGTVSATDGCAIATNGSNGKGGNVITVDGGTIQAAITSEGYVACGIHAANADTVTFGGTAVMNVTGGAGIVARGGTVSVTGGSITTTGDATGKVGNAGGIPCAAIVFDTAAAYPGYDAATSKITVSGGTFVSAADPVQQVKAAGDATAIEVSGGWFSAPVAADFVAAGKVCAQDAANAPSEAATWTVVTTVAITFMNGETELYTTNIVENGAVVYVGETPTKEGDYVFLGWNSDPTATTALASLPAATADETYYAVFKDGSVVEPPDVNPGDGLKDYVPAEGETVPEPIAFDETTGKCSISFVAPEAGRYVLLSSTTVDGEYLEDADSAKTVAKGALVTLTETTAATTKFFKIGWSEE